MDPEKKARFDNGEDLNEPPQQVRNHLFRALVTLCSRSRDCFCSKTHLPASVAAASPSTLDSRARVNIHEQSAVNYFSPEARVQDALALARGIYLKDF